MGSKPKAASEDIATIRLRRQQLAELDDLDKEQNARVKRLQMSAVGARVFRGSAASRAKPADSPGTPAPDNYGLKMSNAPGYSFGRRNGFATERRGGGFGIVSYARTRRASLLDGQG